MSQVNGHNVASESIWNVDEGRVPNRRHRDTGLLAYSDIAFSDTAYSDTAYSDTAYIYSDTA